MSVQLRGYNGVLQRISELRARIDAARPEPQATPIEGTSESAFSGLTGNLTGSLPDGLRPFNPLAGGASIRPTATPTDLKPLIEQAAQEAGIDPALLDSLVAAESSYNPTARSKAGAVGLTQLMEDTAKGLGVTDRTNPTQSLRGGATYLKQMLNRFGGDVQLALAAYNAGPGAVDKFNGIPPYTETQKYVQRVLNLYNSRKNP
jgi:soluble lytic murein transglycosylase-like protein